MVEMMKKIKHFVRNEDYRPESILIYDECIHRLKKNINLQPHAVFLKIINMNPAILIT